MIIFQETPTRVGDTIEMPAVSLSECGAVSRALWYTDSALQNSSMRLAFSAA